MPSPFRLLRGGASLGSEVLRHGPPAHVLPLPAETVRRPAIREVRGGRATFFASCVMR